jgi:hypothetical protein
MRPDPRRSSAGLRARLHQVNCLRTARGDPIDFAFDVSKFIEEETMNYHSQAMEELRRASRAALLGLLATAVMTIIMLIGSALPGASFESRLFPLLLMSHIFSHAAPFWLALITLIVHFGYGTVAAAIFSYLARPMSIGRALAYGFTLWIIMQVTFVPGLLGGVEFGLGVGHPMPALYTLVLHLAYGVTLGWLGARDETAHRASFDEFSRLRVTT